MEDKQDLRAAVRNMLTHYTAVQSFERVWCFTDAERRWLAEAIVELCVEQGIKAMLIHLDGSHYAADDLAPLQQLLYGLTDRDLVFSIFSGGSSIPYYYLFPNLKRPEGFCGATAVIRQRYRDDALLRHLLTSVESVEELTARYLELNNCKRVRVVAPGGTDLTCELMPGIALPYKITPESRHAYLPPAEVTFGVVPGSAKGKVVVDVTVGEFGTRSDGLVDPLGLVDVPVELQIENGYVVEVIGGEIAQRWRRCFQRYSEKCRLVVELGFGLSQGEPTGQIGPDECLQGTFHIGLGNDFFYGGSNDAETHLDVVGAKPRIVVMELR